MIRAALHPLTYTPAWRRSCVGNRLVRSRKLLSTNAIEKDDNLPIHGSNPDDYDQEEGTTSRVEEEPWKALISTSARAAWRASDPRHMPVEKSISSIVKKTVHPTSKISHSVKDLKKLAQKHRKLSNRRYRERERLFRNRRYNKNEVKMDMDATSIYYGPTEALAFLRYRLTPSFQITQRVLEEARSLIGRRGEKTFRPKRILDFGIGCGSATAAALEVFGDISDIEWIHGVDASRTMRETAEHFISNYVKESNEEKDDRKWAPRLTFSAHLSADPSMTADELEESMTRSAFDLCLFTYTAAEMPQTSAILAAAALQWEKLRPGGLMVVIEPGTPDGFSNIRTIRNMLMDCCPQDDESEEQCYILAPCTHQGACPLSLFTKESRMDASEIDVTPVTGESDSENDDDEEEMSGDMTDDDSDEDEEEVTPFRYMTDEERREHPLYDSDDDDDDDPQYVDYVPEIHDALFQKQAEEALAKAPQKKGFCSFSQTFPGRKDEKFSYMVLQKRIQGEEYPQGENSFEGVNVSEMIGKALEKDEVEVLGGVDHKNDELNKDAVELATKYMASDDYYGLELLRDANARSSYGRIIRRPKKRGGHVLLDTCTEDGLVRHTVTRSSSQKAAGLYQAARKARWGGFWPNKASVRRQGPD